MPSKPQASHTALSSPTPTQTAPTDPSPDQEHPMSDFNQSDSVGNYSNELGGRSDAEPHVTVVIIDPIPGQLADGANTIPSGTSVEAEPSNILNAAPKKMRKGKPGSSEGAKQKEKVKIQKFDDECKRYKNELASLEADIISVKDQCARKLKDYKRKRAIVDALKTKRNEVTDMITELCMEVIDYNESN